MKNVIKLGFLALAFGMFTVACGGQKTAENATDSVATEAGQAIDSAAQVADSAVNAVADSAQKTIDSVQSAVADTAHAH